MFTNASIDIVIVLTSVNRQMCYETSINMNVLACDDAWLKEEMIRKELFKCQVASTTDETRHWLCVEDEYTVNVYPLHTTKLIATYNV